jgi:dUTP pyrophosphatase
MNILDFEGLEDLKELVQNIVDFPDEQLNEYNISLMENAVGTCFDHKQRELMAQEMKMTFISSGYSREDIEAIRDEVRNQINQTIEDLALTNEYKKKIVSELLENIYNIYNDATLLYTGYATAIKFQKIHPNAKLPTFAHKEDACADIYAPEDVTIKAGARGHKVDIGLRAAIPEGWELQIRPRSGMSMKTPLRISNSLGTIDSSFLGGLAVLFDNLGGKDYTIHAGDRIAQFALKPVYTFLAEEVENVDDYKQSDRGNGGFGSSGV